MKSLVDWSKFITGNSSEEEALLEFIWGGSRTDFGKNLFTKEAKKEFNKMKKMDVERVRDSAKRSKALYAAFNMEWN